MPLDDVDVNEKIMAINSYKTQTKTLGLLLSVFERKNELFGKYDDLKIQRLGKADGDIMPSETNKIINDPLQDSVVLNLNSGADIYAVYMEVSENNNLHLFIEVKGNIDEETTYNSNLFLFNGGSTSRLNIEVIGTKVSLKQVSKQSIMDIKGIKAEPNKKILHITISSNDIGDYKKLFINVSTSGGAHLLDNTAWRMLTNQPIQKYMCRKYDDLKYYIKTCYFYN